MKTLLLVALASIKRVGDLQAFSVDESCLEFGPGDGHVLLSPRPGYVPKVPTTPFRDQVVSLQALPLEEADPALALLCPVRALRLYTDRTQCLRTSDQLFVSKQRMAHWIVDAITLAYQAQGVPCPLRLRAHSTRGVASSWALARGASLTDICRAAGWATPNTFARFYSLRVEPVSSRVLTSGQRHGEVPAQYRLAALHTLIAPESPYRQTLLSPPITLRQPDVAERPAPGLYSVVSLRTGFRLGPICVTLQGSHMCYSTGCS